MSFIDIQCTLSVRCEQLKFGEAVKLVSDEDILESVKDLLRGAGFVVHRAELLNIMKGQSNGKR